ncbi:CLUMA_CG016768, isoform A [Clunio marinus]|uniref:CLUMA_CG016768, isoform A n=1 Tax=Clunio marinus TaxID=568069 RepID=A0A1J1IWX4_9DIPT|nr:CLUMA_CG016768, isoform A [Clunio marinus]
MHSAYYDVIFERIETVPGDDGQSVLDARTVRVKKFNRTTYVINGGWIARRPLGKSTSTNMSGFYFDGGEYKIFFSKVFGFCDFKILPGHKEIFEDFEAHTTIPVPPEACPYPAMDKEVVNYALKKEHYNFIPPGLPGEQWRININFGEDGVDWGGINIYIVN